MPDWKIETLTTEHERTGFDCGEESLNRWLIERARQWQRKGISRCFIAREPQSPKVSGYYSLSGHHVEFEALADEQAKGIPRIDVPVALLGRLAIDQRSQGTGLGKILLIDALKRVSRISEELGIRAVEVHALNESARDFYRHFGFAVLKDDPNHLFLPTQVIRKLGL